MYTVTNPATGQVVERYSTATDDEVRSALENADKGYRSWRRLAPTDRAKILQHAGEVFAENADELAEVMTLEMGKRYDEGRGEISVVEDIFSYYADNVESLLADEVRSVKGGKACIQKRPVGVILGIMPWNYPVYQVVRFAVPNLLLGNTVLLKHAPSCPKSSALIARLFHDGGVSHDAFINLYATNEQVEWILSDPRVQGVSVTGSERAGSAVAATAGKYLKKVVLELGGSDPMIILDTDDLDATVDVAVNARMGNTGQACNAPKRMIVMNDLYDEFVERLVARMKEFVPGDPMDPATTLAPLSSSDAAERLLAQVEGAAAQGAAILTGGRRVGPDGAAYFEPTVITGVTPDMDVYREELFGPVAVVFGAHTEEEAIRIANDTPFGLGSSIFSTDPERALRVGDRIDAGMVYINEPEGTQADLPFGGVKRSGIGRELGALGIEEFMNKRIIKLPDGEA